MHTDVDCFVGAGVGVFWVSAVGAGRLSWGNTVELNSCAQSVCAVTLSVMIIWAELGWKNMPQRTGLNRYLINEIVENHQRVIGHR